MIDNTAILLAALLVTVTLAVLVLVMLVRVRRVRDNARHEHAVTRRRVMTLTGGEGPAWSGPVAVAEILHAATRSLGEDGQDVSRRADTHHNLPPALARDVCVIITELLDNALCYSDASEEVTLFARTANDGSLLIEIEDSGDGMSRDVLRLANRTLKGAPPDDGKRGLGLVLAGRLAARHGIRVVLAARGDGTMASLVVPSSAGASQAPQRPARQTAPAGQAPAAPPRISPPRQALAPADSGESTAVWAPPWATGGDEGQQRPAAAASETQARRPEHAPPRPVPPTAPHRAPEPPAAPARSAPPRNGSHLPPAYPPLPAANAEPGSRWPLPPTPPGMGSNAPDWLTSAPDTDPGRVPELGAYGSAARGGHEPYAPGYPPDPFSTGSGRAPHEQREEFSPIFDSVVSNWFDAPEAAHDDYSWQSPADHGWSAAERAYGEPTSRAGALPRREPMSHLVPGSVQPGRPASRPGSRDPRSADTWASYQNQVSHGRRGWFRQVGEDADNLGNRRHY